MPDKKSNGGGDTKVGETIVYQPIRRDYLRGTSGPQIAGIVVFVNEDAQTAELTIFPTPGTVDFVHGCKYGEADGQYMKVGEESKTAKALKQAAEEAKKAAEDKAKKDEEEAKQAMEEAAKARKQPPSGTPTIQAQLNYDQHIAEMQYKYPQPQPSK